VLVSKNTFFSSAAACAGREQDVKIAADLTRPKTSVDIPVNEGSEVPAVSREKSEAIVLRGVDFSETSRIVTFLTPDRGLLGCIAKGVRRKNSRFSGVLDTFNRVELVYYWKDGRNVQNLAEASLLDAYMPLKRDFERHAWAAFPLELALKSAGEHAPHRELFDALVSGFDSMKHWRTGAVWHVCWQAFRLLREAGFEPDLDRCIRCGAAVEGPAGFSLEGGALCPDHADNRRLTVPLLTALRALRDAPAACPDAPAGETARAVFGLLHRFSAYQLETGFRSVRVLEELFPEAGCVTPAR
jgi:DNA repair protein RecO (recombination protein O)